MGRLCGAKLRGREGRCSQRAGFGTVHYGTGQCKYHGGSTAVGTRLAAPVDLEILTGHRIDIGPLDALLLCVRIAAAEVSYFTAKIAELKEEEIKERATKEAIASTKDSWDVVELQLSPELNFWIRVRQQSVDSLARYSAMALKAGVEERMVSMAEKLGDVLARLLEGVVNDLQLTAKQKKIAPTVIRKHLALITLREGEVA